MTSIVGPNTKPRRCAAKQDSGHHERGDEERRVDREHEVDPVGRDIGHQLVGDRKPDREEHPVPPRTAPTDREESPVHLVPLDSPDRAAVT